MPITIDFADSDIYKEGVEKGLFEGKLEGLLEGQRKGLLEGIEGMLELKFGLAGLNMMNMVRAINKMDKLEEFKNLIKKAGSVDELKEFLTNSI
ncbi:MAG: hypothetical protein H7844_10220 [Nitrospirae bacterium YQR-1]